MSIHLTPQQAAAYGLKPPSKGKREMNKLESAYGSRLATMKHLGEIRDFGYEAIKLRIGVKRCWYTPDFWVMANDGVLEFHETKGPFCRDDARVKLQAAALLYPNFRFVLARKTESFWDIEAVK